MKKYFLLFLVTVGFFISFDFVQAKCVCDEYDATTKETKKGEEQPFDERHCKEVSFTIDTMAYLNCKWTDDPSDSPTSPSSVSPSTEPFGSAVTVDPRCWTESDCKAEQERQTVPEEQRGIYQGSDAIRACGGKEDGLGNNIGFCSPFSGVKTKITFGNTNYFTDFGDFLQSIYKYAIYVAGLLAVLMVIWAGVEWATSGGSQERIGSAQKKIGGAMMGLFLAVLSYTLLGVINPYLINIRLPQVWLINPASVPAEYCKDLNFSTKDIFAFVGEQSVTFDPASRSSYVYNVKYDPKDSATLSSKFACGNKLLSKGAGGSLCRGHYCPDAGEKKQVCVKKPEAKDYGCVMGNIFGLVTNNSSPMFAKSGWESDADVVDDFDVHVVCLNGTHEGLSKSERLFYDRSDTNMLYVVSLDSDFAKVGVSTCGGADKVAGYVLFPDFDEDLDPTDEGHYIGKDPAGSKLGVDLGDKDSTFFSLISGNSKFKGNPARTYLLDEKSIQEGYQLNINVEKVADVD